VFRVFPSLLRLSFLALSKWFNFTEEKNYSYMFDITSKTVVAAPLALKLHLFPGKGIGLPVSGGGSLEII
jgi:hypothetical protein